MKTIYIVEIRYMTHKRPYFTYAEDICDNKETALQHARDIMDVYVRGDGAKVRFDITDVTDIDMLADENLFGRQFKKFMSGEAPDGRAVDLCIRVVKKQLI